MHDEQLSADYPSKIFPVRLQDGYQLDVRATATLLQLLLREGSLHQRRER
jgi:hypothetical protein